MEAQKTLEKTKQSLAKEQCWKHDSNWVQALLHAYSDKKLHDTCPKTDRYMKGQ